MANLRNRQDEYDDTNIQKPDHPDLYVINPVTGTGLPKFWRSVCSWRYGATHYVINHEPTPGYTARVASTVFVKGATCSSCTGPYFCFPVPGR